MIGPDDLLRLNVWREKALAADVSVRPDGKISLPLINDVQAAGLTPEQQRSALLMRELEGLSYGDLAAALDVTVPAVKSLLVRARIGLVEAQAEQTWFILPQIVGFVIFLVAGFAETNRPPFDLAEADAELVGGYNTEYGGGRFAAYFAAEYLNIVVVSLLTVTLFFGGWLLPFGIDPPTWVDPIVVLVKMAFFVFLFIWVRATLPRLRYDQLMSLGWKVFLPLATLNALVTAILVVTL